MVRRVIVTIARAVPLISSAPSNHLDLRATGSVKVIRLSKGADFEFLDGFDRGRNHTRSDRTGLGAGDTRKVLDVSDRIAGHIVSIVATIDGESVLVHVAAGNIAAGRYSRL